MRIVQGKTNGVSALHGQHVDNSKEAGGPRSDAKEKGLAKG